MKLPKFLHRKLYEYAVGIMVSRPRDQPLWRTEFKDGSRTLYMERWFAIPRNRWLNIYIHRFHASDEDGALHDHPWVNCSFLLQGSYREWVPAPEKFIKTGRVKDLGNGFWAVDEPLFRYIEDCENGHLALRRQQGDIILRLNPAKPHRIELDSVEAIDIDELVADGRSEKKDRPQRVTTLFITGPWMRTWGFRCPKGWVPWRKYVAEEGGRGCP